MKKIKMSFQRILAAIFITVLFLGFIRSNSYDSMEKIFSYLGTNKDQNNEESEISVDTIENEFAKTVWGQKNFINLNGYVANILGMQGLYSNMGMYVTRDKYIVSSYPYTTTDYEYEQIKSFNEFLLSNDINFLYVNEPTKYVDDDWFSESFGIESYANRNIDLLLSRIEADGVNAVDLRKNIAIENLNVFDMFYRTDHHWNTETGLWATRIIAQALNEKCGYDIDLSIYDSDKYEYNEWKACWLGEQGKKVAETYVGLDDYTEIKPLFETSYVFKSNDGSTYTGTFDNFINESVYNIENNVYDNPSWHYSYQRLNCINNNVDKGKVLLIGDSFDHVTEPFLSLGVHEIDSIILRDYDDSFDLRSFILDNGYDTVIVAYTECMVFAHDRESDANYRMYDFE